MSELLSRREFLRMAGIGVAATVLGACQPKVVEKVVKETVVVEGEVKEVTKIVEKEVTRVVEKEVEKPVTATPSGEPVRLTFSVGEQANMPHRPSHMLWYTVWQEKTNIKIDFRSMGLGYGGTFDDKIKLLCAADDVPDFLCIDRPPTLEWRDEAFLPLDDLIDQYAPNYTAIMEKYKFDAYQLYAADGHIYGMSDRTVSYPMGNYYRQDLLEKVGMSPLETLDDWATYIKKAKEVDPVAQGFGAIFDTLLDITWRFRGGFGMEDKADGWLTRRGDEFVDGCLLPEGKECIDLVRKWWGDGLFHPEVLTKFTNTVAAWLQGTVIACLGEYMGFIPIQIAKANEAGKNWDFACVEGPTGPSGRCKGANYTGWTGVCYALGRHNPHPVETMKALNFMFSDEGQVLWAAGVEGVTFTIDSEGHYHYTPEALAKAQEVADEYGWTLSQGLQAEYGINLGGIMAKYRPAAEGMEYLQTAWVGERSIECQAKAANYAVKKWPPPQWTEEEDEERRQIQADVVTFREETWEKMILEEQSMDTWDKYVSDYKKMGGDRLTEMFNEAFDRTMKEHDIDIATIT